MSTINGTQYHDEDSFQTVGGFPFFQWFAKLRGTDESDRLFGYAGNDVLFGNGGNDLLDSGTGNDWMEGGAGSDTYRVFDAGDRVIEGLSADRDTVETFINNYILTDHVERLILSENFTLSENGATFFFASPREGSGNNLNNWLEGNSTDNRLSGLAGQDKLIGAAGNDNLFGDSGDDDLFGGSGNDGLFGGFDNDSLFGESGNDRLWGADGDDHLFGGLGNDTLNGEMGSDRLVGGVGADTLTGGGADDIFVFLTLSEGIDIITDFNWNRTTRPILGRDVVEISASGFGATSSRQFRYEAATGNLFFDASSSDTIAPQWFATLQNRPTGFSASRDIRLI